MIMLLKKARLKFAAKFMLMIMVFEIIHPLSSLALTTGPSQPEMQTFEPVGTSNLVDLFSGGFKYNIPLLDVDGYPVNIAYNSGLGVDQEASWVGLGWNLNVGNINHVVRGIPDDFNGEHIEKELEMKPEETTTVSLDVSAEIFGSKQGDKGLKKLLKYFGLTNFGLDYTINNYSGVSVAKGVSQRLNFPKITKVGNFGADISFKKSTKHGGDLDYSVFYRKDASSESNNKLNISHVVSLSNGINSREGAKQLAFSYNPSITMATTINKKSRSLGIKPSISFVPIGVQNYYPSITTKSKVTTLKYQLKLGSAAQFFFGAPKASLTYNKVKQTEDPYRKAYGYFNLENADESSITDFTRDHTGILNNNSEYMPSSSLTYDLYAVNGQGTGGNFRAYRNDFGTTGDPDNSKSGGSYSVEQEIGFGSLFSVGTDVSVMNSKTEATKWETNEFESKASGDAFEPYYFKQAGELTRSGSQLTDNSAQDGLESFRNLPTAKRNSRASRSNLLYYLTPHEAALKQISTTPKLENYNDIDFGNLPSSVFPDKKYNYEILKDQYTSDRPGLDNKNSKQASEFIQTLPNGQRYVYGLPVMNLVQKDYQISTDQQAVNGLVPVAISGGKPDLGTGNNDLYQTFKSVKTTPAYAHSYQLTAILSPDYVDVTGDGLTPDDLGTYTKFNYAKKNTYVWRTPYGNQAFHAPGIKGDCNDDKANFSVGAKENWLLHSIETRNYVAEFHVKERLDGVGANHEGMLDISNINNAKSYRLDKIVLYNRSERLGAKSHLAKPIKTILFSYDYSLCAGVENSNINNGGKLTLKGIYIKYGSSEIGYLSPYTFEYNGGVNASYGPLAKDFWGTYKPENANSAGANNLGLNLDNQEFPYTDQSCDASEADSRVAAWCLSKISLPSGGSIDVDYESDDYAYVQEREAMEMFKIEGVGPTAEYSSSNILYEGINAPYRYIYFKRKIGEERFPSDLKKTYLGDAQTIQFNAEVLYSNKKLDGCGALEERIKGYAKVVEVGACPGSSTHGYIKVEGKQPKALIQRKKDDANTVHPITYAALNFARYNSTKLIYPDAEIPSLSAPGAPKKIIKLLMASAGDGLFEILQNPIRGLVKKGVARHCILNKSYVRLKTPDLKKRGGGERVKRVTFSDSWKGTNQVNTYGQEYDYTIPDPNSLVNRKISSGVASYEPMSGGDENPYKDLLYSQTTKDQKVFPPNDPVTLLNEAPIGESFYPNASVGYSRVTVKSIHHNEGASVQSAKVHEFYTAKDFPVRVEATDINKDKANGKPRVTPLILAKLKSFSASQGYSIFLNDMHGKVKKESVYRMYNGDIAKAPESYTSYDYFSKDKSLDNEVPCLVAKKDAAGNADLSLGVKEEKLTLGEEIDVTIDSRKNHQRTFNADAMFNLNVAMGGPTPVSIPSFFLTPTYSQNDSYFMTSTKVVQQYGIIKSIETFNKGAKVKVENSLFDPETGEVLSTKENTEFGKDENTYSMKYPGHWAYNNMGHASGNVLFEEELIDEVMVIDGVAYLKVFDKSKYELGDEFILTGAGCDVLNGNIGGIYRENKFKLWVTDKDVMAIPPYSFNNCISSSIGCNQGEYYDMDATNSCIDFNALKGYLFEITKNPFFSNLSPNNKPVEVEFIPIGVDKDDPITPKNFIYEVQGYGRCGFLNVMGRREVFQDKVTVNRPVPVVRYRLNAPSNYTHLTELELDVKVNVSSVKTHLNTLTAFDTKAAMPTGTPNWGGETIYKGSGPFYRLIIKFPYNPAVGIPANPLTSSFTAVSPFKYPTAPYNIPANNRVTLWGCATSGAQSFNTNLTRYTTETRNNFSYNNNEHYGLIKAKVLKLGVQDIGPNYATNGNWPENGTIRNAKIKVVRSGKRNLLSASVMEHSTTDNPIDNVSKDLKPSYLSMLSAGASEYTTGSLQPQSLASDYKAVGSNQTYNKFITGEEGNYKIEKQKIIVKDRKYTTSGIESDKDRGTFELGGTSSQTEKLAWEFGPTNLNTYLFGLTRAMTPNPIKPWQVVAQTSAFSPWGGMIEGRDAVDNKNASIMGYSHRLPVATVSNSAYDEAMVENFEDYLEALNATVFDYKQNALREDILAQVTPSTQANSMDLVGTDYDIIYSLRHSGKAALKIKNTRNIQIPIEGGSSSLSLKKQYFQPNKEYIMTYWQQVLTTSPPLVGQVRLVIPGALSTHGIARRKTPVIDGWAQFETKVSIPDLQTLPANPTATLQAVTTGGPIYIDDIRIFPAKGNMKSYVYNATNRRLMAVLDENNMSTYFEYDGQGKLIRIKKETEKGVLTLKESRESLINYLEQVMGILPNGISVADPNPINGQ